MEKSVVKCELYLDTIIRIGISKSFVIDVVKKHRHDLDLYLNECKNKKKLTYNVFLEIPNEFSFCNRYYKLYMYKNDEDVIDICIFIGIEHIATFGILKNEDNMVDELINATNKKMDELIEKLLS